MALTGVSLTASGSTTDAGSFTTASVAPAARSVLLLWVVQALTGGATVSSVTGLGLTWTKQKSIAISTSTTFDCWTATVGDSAPSSGAVTINLSATVGSIVWDLDQYTDPVGMPSLVTTNNPTSGPTTSLNASVTYAAARSTGSKFAYGCGAAGFVTQLPAETANWTELADQEQATPSCAMETQVSPGSTVLTGQSTLSSSVAWVCIGIEVAAATSNNVGPRSIPVIPPGMRAPSAWALPFDYSSQMDLSDPTTVSVFSNDTGSGADSEAVSAALADSDASALAADSGTLAVALSDSDATALTVDSATPPAATLADNDPSAASADSGSVTVISGTPPTAITGGRPPGTLSPPAWAAPFRASAQETLGDLSILPAVAVSDTDAFAATVDAGAIAVLLTNSAEGGTNGVAVTTGNSGGTSGSAFDGISGTNTIFDTTHPAHGSLGYKVVTTTAATSSLNWSNAMGNPDPVTSWFRLYLYFTANPGATWRIWNATLTGTGSCMSLSILTVAGAAKLRVTAGTAGTTIFTMATTVPLNALFRVEGFVTGSPTAGQVELKMFLTPDSVTADETQTSASNINTAGVPTIWSNGSSNSIASVGPYWMDDLGLSSIGYIGPAGTPATPVSDSDTGSGADAETPPPATLSGTDASALSVDAGAASATLSDSDLSAAAADAGAASATLSSTDASALSADSGAASATFTSTDAFALSVDSGAASAAFTSTDAFTLTVDAGTPPPATFTATDASALSADSGAAPPATLADTDLSAAAAEAAAVSASAASSAAVGLFPPGTLSPMAWPAAFRYSQQGALGDPSTVSVFSADTGSGLDAGPVSVAVTSTDAFALSADTSAIAATLPDTDTGSGLEAQSLAAAFTSTDASALSADAGTLAAAFTGTDAFALSADAGTPPPATLADTDTGSGLDAATAPPATLADTDPSAAAAETGSVSVAAVPTTLPGLFPPGTLAPPAWAYPFRASQQETLGDYTTVSVFSADTGTGADGGEQAGLSSADTGGVATTGGTWAKLQEVPGSTAAALTTPQITVAATANHSFLAGFFSRSGGSGTGAMTGVTDSAGNTWTHIASGAVASGAQTRIELWVLLDSGTTPITWVQGSSAASQDYAWSITEWAGATSVALDVTSPLNSGVAVASTTIDTVPETPTGSTGLVLAGISFPQTTTTFNTAGWTELTAFNFSTARSTRAAFYAGAGGAGAPVAAYTAEWLLGVAKQAGTITAVFSGTLVGGGAETGKVTVTDTDTGSGADTSAIAATLADTDTGAGLDAGAPVAGVPASTLPGLLPPPLPPGTLAPAAWASPFRYSSQSALSDPSTVSVFSADTGSAFDDGSLLERLSDTDTGSFTDAETPPPATLTAADTGFGIDAASAPPATLAGADTGSGLDTGTVVARPAGTDAGTLTDAGTAPPATLSDSDAGTAADTGTVSTGIPKSGTDTGHFEDAGISFLADPEAGTGTEAAQVAATLTDAGAFTETQAIVGAYQIASADTGACTDTGYWTGPLASADTGTLTDGVTRAFLADTDGATGTDSGPVIDVFPEALRAGDGKYHLVWHPGQPDEHIVLSSPRLSKALLLAQRDLNRAYTLTLPADADTAAAAEGWTPLATVTALVVSPDLAIEVLATPAVPVALPPPVTTTVDPAPFTIIPSTDAGSGTDGR